MAVKGIIIYITNAGSPQPKYLSANSCFFMQEPRCKVLKLQTQHTHPLSSKTELVKGMDVLMGKMSSNSPRMRFKSSTVELVTLPSLSGRNEQREIPVNFNFNKHT